jgi:hypothetical protein
MAAPSLHPGSSAPVRTVRSRVGPWAGVGRRRHPGPRVRGALRPALARP